MKNIFKNISKIKYILPLLVLVVCVAFAVNSFTNGSFSADSVNKRETINIENSTTNSTTTSSTGSNAITTSPLPSESGNNNSTSNSEKVKSVLPLTLNSNQKYKDGTYYGTGVGFNGNLTVKVTIKNGKITNIDIVKTGDGDDYIAKAKGLLKSIYAKQNTNVDTVSGATYSSNGLIEAVSNAISKAVVNKDNSKSYANNNKNTNNIATTTTPTTTKPSTTTPTKPLVKKTTVSLARTNGSVYVKGRTTVKATVKNGKGKTTYKSNNTGVAKVSSTGVVTGVKKGIAVITVTNNRVSRTFKVTVKNPSLNRTTLNLKAKKNYTLKVQGKIGKVTFKSSNTKVATVNAKGKVVAKKKGNATITVKANGITLKCKVKVK